MVTRRVPASSLRIASTSARASGHPLARGRSTADECRARIGQAQGADPAIDEHHARLAFDLGHDLRDRRLGVVEPVCGRRERAGLTDGLEHAELTQIVHNREEWNL